ncbi:TPA: molecular chaperone GroEL, partial [Escherichia coli]|nr:molecular chaperone GroEL [Escherichia coli]HDV2964955.1 molecular chaperone GroEL [Escherichia coli]
MSKAKFSAQAEKLKNLVDSARLQTSSSAVTATVPSQPNEGTEEVSGRPVAARTKAKNLKAIPLSYFEA